MASIGTGLIGAAGEYHVAAQLSMRGWLATVTIKNSPGTDVLAQHATTGRVVAIQTKTTSQRGASLVLGRKDEIPDPAGRGWYVLVAMRGTEERPVFYVIPRNHVAALMWVGHRAWLSAPGRAGHVRKDSPVREIRPGHVESYRERWDALEDDAARMPYDLPEWFWEGVPRFGLPPGHPDEPMLRDSAAGRARQSGSPTGA
jgi:hypothetical protein